MSRPSQTKATTEKEEETKNEIFCFTESAPSFPGTFHSIQINR